MTDCYCAVCLCVSLFQYFLYCDLCDFVSVLISVSILLINPITTPRLALRTALQHYSLASRDLQEETICNIARFDRVFVQLDGDLGSPMYNSNIPVDRTWNWKLIFFKGKLTD